MKNPMQQERDRQKAKIDAAMLAIWQPLIMAALMRGAAKRRIRLARLALWQALREYAFGNP